MAITIKRTKKTLVTMPGQPAETTGSEAPGAETPEQNAAEPEMTVVATPGRGGGSYMVFAIIALVAVLLFGTLLIMQGVEWSFYQKPPSAFPVVNR